MVEMHWVYTHTLNIEIYTGIYTHTTHTQHTHTHTHKHTNTHIQFMQGLDGRNVLGEDIRRVGTRVQQTLLERRAQLCDQARILVGLCQRVLEVLCTECVCVCVWERERDRQRERESERE